MQGLVRGLRGRCPHCGGHDVFARWGHLRERCPRCGYSFEREEGYWVGAMIVNLGVAQLLFMAVLLGTIALTTPDVPWTPLLVVAGGLMVVVPIAFYPRSKTVWVWLDIAVHPYADDERDWPDAG